MWIKSITVERKRDRQNSVLKGFICVLLILLQVGWLYLSLVILSSKLPWLANITSSLVLIIVLVIYGRHMNSAMKMPWIILILLFPAFGVFMYLLTGMNGVTGYMRKRYKAIDDLLFPLLPECDKVLEEMAGSKRQAANQSRYIRDYSFYPVYDNTAVTYYDSAEKGFEAQLEELSQAKRFIFMDYHAIENASAFRRLRAVLKERAAAGVEVRLFYDYVGSMVFVNDAFMKGLQEDGIRVRVFNPIVPFINLFLNNRDHRKITVIDGRVGFTGGYNLADEYFNITHPYGHWLDTGIKLEGEAVKNLTAAFLENWNAIRGDDIDDVNFKKYLPEVGLPGEIREDLGFVQPYADIPVDEEQVGENVYMNVLNQAEEYAWFITPYLIITDEMNQAFVLAAKRGVDVRIITPGIPDKKLIYELTRSYYGRLVRAGVKIYEYTPGFSHAKMCVSDDSVATCGTINLDYRSFYHHFENGCFLCQNQAVMDIRDHFQRLFPECNEVTEAYKTESVSLRKRIFYCIMRLMAPLM